jgi:hypothetical protein
LFALALTIIVALTIGTIRFLKAEAPTLEEESVQLTSQNKEPGAITTLLKTILVLFNTEELEP